MAENKIKIMLIDDEADFTKPMAFWLTSKGYSVTEMNNGEEALKLVKDAPPDIIFLDLNMPVMDGVEVLKRLRDFNKEIPVIFISAYVDDPRLIEANPYGISGIFFKGSDFEKGLILIEIALKRHKQLKK